LLKAVRAKAANPRKEIREIHFAIRIETRPGVFRNDVLDDSFHPLSGWIWRFYRKELAIDAENDWRSDFQVDVGSMCIDGGVQDLMKEFHERQRNNAPKPRPERFPFAGHLAARLEARLLTARDGLPLRLMAKKKTRSAVGSAPGFASLKAPA
jgi:hypothetical protein